MDASWRHGRRQGLTLVEVLLVLGLLVILASIAWPVLDHPLATRRLHVAADTLRTEWARARNQAVAEGQTVRFQYTLGERNYSIDKGNTGTTTTPSADESMSETDLSLDGEESESGPMLPEGITFLTVEVTDELDDTLGVDQSLAADLGQDASCTPVLFYPDGSTSTARVVLKNEYDRCIEVTLRGLTGVSSVGEVFSDEGASP